MERVAADIEGIHLGIADLDALLVGPLVENAFDLHPPESIRRTGLHAQLDSLIFARRHNGYPLVPIRRVPIDRKIIPQEESRVSQFLHWLHSRSPPSMAR